MSNATTNSRRAALITCALAAAALNACGTGAGTSGGGALTVAAGDDSCETTVAELQAGTHTITVRNEGSKVTEVYVYAVGDRIMGEVENVAPGLQRTFQVALTPGRYDVACKPGMVGKGIRQALTVTGTTTKASTGRQLADAVAGYRRYVVSQTAELQRRTTEFTDALRAGDLEQAKRLYAGTRKHYERIEPIAETFSELDTAIDIREGGNPKGTPWTGFHRIEKELWENADVRAAARFADRLDRDVARLRATVRTTKITPEQLANGARQLMDEVATGKITGEEERYSHTDLDDFQANLEGAQTAYANLRPIVAERDPELAELVDRRFDRVQDALLRHRSGDGFVTYDRLTKADIRTLASVVDGLSEPLSRVGGVVLR